MFMYKQRESAPVGGTASPPPAAPACTRQSRRASHAPFLPLSRVLQGVATMAALFIAPHPPNPAASLVCADNAFARAWCRLRPPPAPSCHYAASPSAAGGSWRKSLRTSLGLRSLYVAAVISRETMPSETRIPSPPRFRSTLKASSSETSSPR